MQVDWRARMHEGIDRIIRAYQPDAVTGRVAADYAKLDLLHTTSTHALIKRATPKTDDTTSPLASSV